MDDKKIIKDVIYYITKNDNKNFEASLENVLNRKLKRKLRERIFKFQKEER